MFFKFFLFEKETSLLYLYNIIIHETNFTGGVGGGGGGGERGGGQYNIYCDIILYSAYVNL